MLLPALPSSSGFLSHPAATHLFLTGSTGLNSLFLTDSAPFCPSFLFSKLAVSEQQMIDFPDLLNCSH